MSLELKKKAVKESFFCIPVCYCDLQYLLRKYTKTGFVSNRYGWACDVYQINMSSWAICTGYHPIDNINVDRTELNRIINKYNKIAANTNNEAIDKLLNRFMKEVIDLYRYTIEKEALEHGTTKNN